MAVDLTGKIEEWRAHLLDTSKRNRLINFKYGAKAGGVLLVHPAADGIWQQMVVTNECMTFPWKRDLIELPPEPPDDAITAAGPTLYQPDRVPSLSMADVLVRCSESRKLRSDHLLTQLADKDLATRLTSLQRNAGEFLSEQGINILYVAFGLLRWYESDDSDVEILSPLLLGAARKLTLEKVAYGAGRIT